MISRVIEARPEELRGFIEEAAGISKYKERRRETENRIAHTKENLERLDRRARGSREAVAPPAAAGGHGAPLPDLEAGRAQADRGAAGAAPARDRAGLAVEGRHPARARHGDAGVDRRAALRSKRRSKSAREDFTEKSEALNVVQGRYYQIGAEISRTEQSIQHGRELRQRQRQDLEQAEQGATEANLHLARDQSQIDELRRELEQLEPGLERGARARARIGSGAGAGGRVDAGLAGALGRIQSRLARRQRKDAGRARAHRAAGASAARAWPRSASGCRASCRS